MDEFETGRRLMVERQLVKRGLCDPRLLAAFEAIPRHLFVPRAWRAQAYQDCALPIAGGQTISQPYIVALMTDLLGLHGGEKVLEVGTGSGYQAAILSHLAGSVYTIEYDARLAREAKTRLESLDCGNVQFREGDGSAGWPDAGPFDGILVTAGGPHVPPPLLGQLGEGGRLVMPVGARGMQELEIWSRRGEAFERRAVAPVVFVPLRGEYGWQE